VNAGRVAHGNQLAGAVQEQRRFVGWDAIAATLILLVAASNVAGWVQNLPTERFLVRALWWILYLGAFLRLVQRFGAGWLAWMMRHQSILCLLLAWAVLSALWSLAPLETLLKSLSLVGTTILGVYIGYTLPPSQIAGLLRGSFAAVIVSSLVALTVLPASIVAMTTGEWRGLMDHKNSFGAMSAIASLCFLAAAFRRAPRRIWWSVMCGACLLAVLLSQSRTALVSCAVGGGTLVWFNAMKTRCSPRVALLLLVLLLGTAAAAATYAREPLTGMIRKGDGLNGRFALWAGAVQIIRERPLTGYGYSAVWGKKKNTLLPHIPITAHNSASSAHNAFLSTATELGVPAAVLLVMYGLLTLLHAVQFYENRATSFSLFVIAFLFATATISITEANMLGIHWIFWILFVAIAVMLKRSQQASTR